MICPLLWQGRSRRKSNSIPSSPNCEGVGRASPFPFFPPSAREGFGITFSYSAAISGFAILPEKITDERFSSLPRIGVEVFLSLLSSSLWLDGFRACAVEPL